MGFQPLRDGICFLLYLGQNRRIPVAATAQLAQLLHRRREFAHEKIVILSQFSDGLPNQLRRWETLDRFRRLGSGTNESRKQMQMFRPDVHGQSNPEAIESFIALLDIGPLERGKKVREQFVQLGMIVFEANTHFGRGFVPCRC